MGKSKRKYVTGDFRKYCIPKKYNGDLSKPINFRSSYELQFMRQLENNPKVEWWNFENIKIPYIIKNGANVSRHNYIMDFQVKFLNGDMYLCEVKPAAKAPLNEAQMRLSDDHKRNAYKWRQAMAWCKTNNHIFKLITEKQLFGR